MKRKLFISALCLACVTQNVPALAGFDPHDWQVRVRAIDVSPQESSSTSNGGKIAVDSAVVPELDISYFFTDAISAELILATSKHRVREVSPSVDLGSVWVLPPTLTAQYHFNNSSNFTPYVGAGINYTIFYNADPGAMASVKYKNTVGYAFQIGFDYKIDERWFLNADVKKIFINTDANVNGTAVTADVDLDPLVTGVGFGYRF